MATPVTTGPVAKLPRSSQVQFTLKGGVLDARQLTALRAELVDRIADPEQPASVEVVASDAAGVAAVCTSKRISRQHAYSLRKASAKPPLEEPGRGKQKFLNEYQSGLNAELASVTETLKTLVIQATETNVGFVHAACGSPCSSTSPADVQVATSVRGAVVNGNAHGD